MLNPVECQQFLSPIVDYTFSVQSHLKTFENDPLEKLSLPEQLNFLLDSMNFNAGNNDKTVRVSNQVSKYLKTEKYLTVKYCQQLSAVGSAWNFAHTIKICDRI